MRPARRLALVAMLGIAPPLGAETGWVGIGLADRSVQAIGFEVADHPNRTSGGLVLYAGTQDGILRSADEGATWTEINHGLTDSDVLSLAVHQTAAPSRGPAVRYQTAIYAGTPSGVFRSLDHGDNWMAVNTGLGRYTWTSALATDLAGTVYASTRSGLYKSLDQGANWLSISNGTRPGWGSRAVTIDSRAAGEVYGGQGSLFRSDNGGQTWADLTPGRAIFLAFIFDPVAIRLSPSSRTILMTGVADCAPCGQPPWFGVVRSDDGGANWSDMSSVIEDAADFAFPEEAVELAAVYPGVSRSSDGGVTWNPLNAGLPVEAGFSVLRLEVSPISPKTVYAGTMGGIFRFGPPAASGPRVVPKRQELS